MDTFHEEVVVRHSNRGIVQLQFVLCWVLCIISGIAALTNFMDLFIEFSILGLVFTLVYAGVCVATYYFRDANNIEYEYTLTNGDLDFARVIANRKRKQDMTVALKSVMAAGFVKNENFARFDSTPGAKKHNFYLNRDKPHYFLLFRGGKDESTHLVVYEPSEALEELVRKYVPRENYYA